MEAKDFSTSIQVDATPAQVFDAVTNVRGWWSRDIKGKTRNVGDEFVFEVPGIHFSRHKLVEAVPGEKVVWLVTESRLSFVDDKTEWTGTRMVFTISRQGGKTKLVFTHEGLAPQVECYDACAPAWTQYVQASLSALITTGTGTPNLE